MKKKEILPKDLNVMIALDLTEMDAILLKYASYLCEVISPKHFYFTHNIKQSKLYNIYEELLEENLTVDEIIEEALDTSIRDNYTGKTEFTTIITTDEYTESILDHLTDKYKIDLVMIGYKNEFQGTGALTQKLAKMLDSHLLLIPEEAQSELNKILVPTDFSSSSVNAFLAAEELTAKTNGCIEALHVYNIPSYFFPYINTKKAEDKTRAHLEGKMKSYLKKNKLKETIKFKNINKEDLSIVEVIKNQALKNDFDLIIVTARGANTITSLFLGSTTNELITSSSYKPVLMIN
ncbi:MAG: universal stress protein [Flavobacteriaceae bacterium]|nr:universal stress protein [Psychroflexus sp.]